jgi:hypothetical protein
MELVATFPLKQLFYPSSCHPFFASLCLCGLALRFDQTMNHEGHEEIQRPDNTLLLWFRKAPGITIRCGREGTVSVP